MDIFVKARNGEGLSGFASRMAKLLGLSGIEMRESSSYVGNEYFVATALSVRVSFAIADDAGLEEYDFWISIASTGVWLESETALDGLADLIARRLAVEGEVVARLPSPLEGGPLIVYLVEPNAPAGSKGQVVTTERRRDGAIGGNTTDDER